MEAPWVSDGARRVARSVRRHILTTIATGRQAGPRRYTMIRYEDLTHDPQLRHVCNFVGEEFDPAMLDAGARADARTVTDAVRPWQLGVSKVVSSERQGTWMGRLSRADRARVAAVVRRELAVLGYEPARLQLVVAGMILNQLNRPADIGPAVERRRRARRLRTGGPEAMHAQVIEFVRT